MLTKRKRPHGHKSPNMQMNESIAPSRGDVLRAKGLAVLQVRMRKHLIYTVIIVERSEDY